jgi:hypothetical protein
MKVSDEIVSVLLVQGHEGATHHNEFNLICVVAQSLQLLYPILGLKVGVVSSTDGPHAGRLITCIGLSRVLKVRVGTARTIHADIPCHCDMRAPMRLAHHSHHSNATSGSNRLPLQERGQLIFVRIRQCRKYVDDFRHPSHLVLGGDLSLQLREIDLLTSVISLNYLLDDLTDSLNHNRMLI